MSDRLRTRFGLSPPRRAQNLHRRHRLAIREAEFLAEDVEQSLDRATRVAAVVFEVLDLFDGDAKPDRKLGLRDLRSGTQLTNVFRRPLHTPGNRVPPRAHFLTKAARKIQEARLESVAGCATLPVLTNTGGLDMDILIQADGLTLTDDLKAAVEQKIGRVEQYAPRAVRARVRIRKTSAHANQAQYVVRVLIELPGRDLSAEQIGPEPMSALDILAEKIERRLRKRKTRRLASRKTRVRE